MKVSIIIPVYNVEKYLPRCVQSVIEQTYKNLEIILVDDGTKDNSGKMCDEYAAADQRITVIHKKNGGLSSARNAGIEIATGETVFFLDSDDYLSRGCIEKAVELMKKTGSDVTIVQMKYIPEEENLEAEYNESSSDYITLSPDEAIAESLYQKLYTCCAPAKLYKRKVIGNIRFPLGRISEDLATCHLFLDNANLIVYSEYFGYYYRQHESSIMHVFNSKRMDALEWAFNIENFCKEKYPHIMNASICRTFNVAIHLLLELPDDGDVHDEHFAILWESIKRTRINVLQNPKVRSREKVAAVLSFGGEKLLKLVWNSKFAVRKD